MKWEQSESDILKEEIQRLQDMLKEKDDEIQNLKTLNKTLQNQELTESKLLEHDQQSEQSEVSEQIQEPQESQETEDRIPELTQFPKEKVPELSTNKMPPNVNRQLSTQSETMSHVMRRLDHLMHEQNQIIEEIPEEDENEPVQLTFDYQDGEVIVVGADDKQDDVTTIVHDQVKEDMIEDRNEWMEIQKTLNLKLQNNVQSLKENDVSEHGSDEADFASITLVQIHYPPKDVVISKTEGFRFKQGSIVEFAGSTKSILSGWEEQYRIENKENGMILEFWDDDPVNPQYIGQCTITQKMASDSKRILIPLKDQEGEQVIDEDGNVTTLEIQIGTMGWFAWFKSLLLM